METVTSSVSRVITQLQQTRQISTASQPPAAHDDSDYECPVCHGLGWLREEREPGDPKFGELVPCKCMATEWQRRLVKFSRLSPEMQGYRLEEFIPRGKACKDVTAQLRRALDDGRGWVTLSGPPGTGKTFLLAAVANEAIARQMTTVYTTTADLLADLRETFNPESGVGFSQLFTDVSEAQVLCLDELEKFRPTAWAEEQFFRMAEKRYREQAGCLTVLATNRRIGLDKPILQETQYPGYLESRILDGRFLQIDEFWQTGDVRPVLKRETA